MPELNDLIFLDDAAPVAQMQPQTPQKPPEGIGQYLGRQLVSGVEKLAEIPTDISGAITGFTKGFQQDFEQAFPFAKGAIAPSLAEQYTPTSEQVRAKAEQLTGYEPGSFTPQGTFENIVQNGIRTAALTGLTGGATAITENLLPIIGSSIGGEILPEIGSLIGLPESTRELLGIAGSVWGSTLGTRRKTNAIKNDLYTTADQALASDPQSTSYISFTTPRVTQVADNLLDKTQKLPGYEKIQPVVQQFKNLAANQGRINVKDAWEFKKRLNELLPSFAPDIRNNFAFPMLNTLNEDVLRSYAKANPSFGNAFLRAEKDNAALKNKLVQFDRFKNAGENVLRKVTENPDKFGKYAKAAAYTAFYGGVPLGSLFYGPGVIGLGATGLSANALNRFGSLLKNSKTAQELMAKSITDMFAGNTARAMSRFAQISREMDKQQQQEQNELVFI